MAEKGKYFAFGFGMAALTGVVLAGVKFVRDFNRSMERIGKSISDDIEFECPMPEKDDCGCCFCSISKMPDVPQKKYEPPRAEVFKSEKEN